MCYGALSLLFGRRLIRSENVDALSWDEHNDMARPTSKRNLSNLQKTILQWLYTDYQRRQAAGEGLETPYTDIVRAVATDKAGVTLTLRQLMRKGLLLITLPRGGRTRCVMLTEEGKASVETQAADKRQSGAKGYLDDFTKLVWQEQRLRLAAKRRNRNQPTSRKRERRRWRDDDDLI